jgi:hypothetical protein
MTILRRKVNLRKPKPPAPGSYVAFEYVKLIQEARRQINRLDFSSIVWTKKGRPLNIPQAKKDKWDLIGLNNTDFVECYEDLMREKK